MIIPIGLQMLCLKEYDPVSTLMKAMERKPTTKRYKTIPILEKCKRITNTTFHGDYQRHTEIEYWCCQVANSRPQKKAACSGKQVMYLA